jgi:hypothetical protein
MYELGGVDERTQLAVKDIVRDIILKDRLKKSHRCQEATV